MRSTIFLIATACLAQVPPDPYELAGGKTVVKTVDRTQGLELLNKAKRPMRLLAPMTQPYLLTVNFTATGDAANSGPGELTQLWLGQQNSRWTARLAGFSLNRSLTRLGTFDEKPVALVPMRVHMLRNSIFWAGQGLTASSQFRSAAVEWNGRPTTCLLVSDQPAPEESSSRRWDEAEYCIDNQSRLLQILSVAPGIYSLYGYSAGQVRPDRIRTYIAGALVTDASLRFAEPGDADRVIPAPTAEMLASEKPVAMEEPMRTSVTLTGNPGTVIVNAQVGPDGKVVVEEPCAASDPALSAQALDRVKTMEFGRSGVQRQAYVQVHFIPAQAPPLRTKAPTPIIPTEPYTLERTISGPNKKFDTKEILARRSDGATLRMHWIGPAEGGQFVRELKFPDGRSLTLYDSVKAKVTWPAMTEIEVRMLTSPARAADCSGGRPLLRDDQMEGQEVDVFQITAGSFRATMWAAPKLGCEHLYVNSEVMKADGSFGPSMETKTTRLAIGEPEPRLFEIAPDLVEMKPSAAQKRVWESLDLGLGPEEKAALLRDIQRESAEADRRYQAKRN